MATPRSLLVDPVNECDYHIVSRCVRRAFLCGFDDLTGRDCSHRRDWVVERLRQLAPCFAIDVYSYTVMSNHFHLVLRYDPGACRSWTDEEVAQRWFDAFPPTVLGQVVEELKPELRELMLGDAERMARARRSLGSLSDFMKHLKQPIARRANMEDDCQGHFFEQRFYSGALLTEEALIAAMVYVDLNPVRAQLTERIEAIQQTSIADRLQENSAEALADYLRPVVSGLVECDARLEAAEPPREQQKDLLVEPSKCDPRTVPDDDFAANKSPTIDLESIAREEDTDNSSRRPESGSDEEPRPRRTRRPRPAMALADYIELLRTIAEAEQTSANPPNRIRRWIARTTMLRKRQRAYGTQALLKQWMADRGLQLREAPLPA